MTVVARRPLPQGPLDTVVGDGLVAIFGRSYSLAEVMLSARPNPAIIGAWQELTAYCHWSYGAFLTRNRPLRPVLARV